MASAIYRHGDPIMDDYTPTSAAVAAGDVVVFGTAGWTCGVAHTDIAQNKQGALALLGGIYDVINADNAGVGVKVYWDATNKKVTTTSTGNALFGYIVANGNAGANSLCRAFHHPIV